MTVYVIVYRDIFPGGGQGPGPHSGVVSKGYRDRAKAQEECDRLNERAVGWTRYEVTSVTVL